HYTAADKRSAENVNSSWMSGLEVVEAGRALKVQTDSPHLVSLGGGRLSTAVTLHPLPPGCQTMGSARDADIVVQGTGVEPLHCHIDNSNGVVTLYPLAEMTSVDGLKVTIPTRLTQGCMLCIGRSNYLRFNHPAEARLMKSILPNTRISIAPISAYQGCDGVERKPPMAPRRSPRDSWGEMSTSSSCTSGGDDFVLGKVSRFELMAHSSRLQHISPKVFPSGSPTANSPASAVLGPSRASPIPHSNGINPRSHSRSGTPTNVNGNVTPVLSSSRAPAGVSRSVTSSPAFDRGSTRSLSGSNEVSRYRLMTPSPAFNRNPLPYSPGSAFRSVTPTPGHRRTMSAGNGELADTLRASSNCSSLEELNARNDELEVKRKQEILNMCAEYERQAQCEKQHNKPPATPTLQQNRIKTNGSLPRDKRLASPSATGASEDEMGEVFTFETNTTSVVGSFSLNYSPVQSTSTEMAARDAVSPLPPNMIHSPYENVMIPAPGTVVHPQSPRTRIRTIAPSAKDMSEVIENRLAVSSDYEYVSSVPHGKTAQETSEKSKFILPLENGNTEQVCDATVISNSQAVNGDQQPVKLKSPAPGEVEQLRRERGKLLATMSGLKRKVADIKQQEEELLRE
ncbi:hypothetical protein L9F63_023685, partial [Diploptera punctata]